MKALNCDSPRPRGRRNANEPATPDFLALGRLTVHCDDGGEADAFHVNYPWFWQTVPSRQEVRLYSNLPLDIVRTIFDMAMREQPRPCHLLLVSREVKSWVEPLLYQHIYIHNQRQLGLFYRTFRERWVLGQQTDPTKGTFPSPRDTQTVIICCGDMSHSFKAMLREMTNLRSIECWPDMFISPADVIHAPVKSIGHEEGGKPDDPYPFKNLRRLSFDAFRLLSSGIMFNHWIFRDVTHMTLYFCESAPWGSLHYLQNLTHFGLDVINYRPLLLSTADLETWTRRVINACPASLQVFVLCCIDMHNKDFDMLDFRNDSSENDDVRLPSSTVTRSKDYRHIRADGFHFLSQLALGKVDPRIVVGSAVALREDHTFRDCLVYYAYRDLPQKRNYRWQRFYRLHGHVEDCWYEAQTIIEGRVV